MTVSGQRLRVTNSGLLSGVRLWLAMRGRVAQEESEAEHRETKPVWFPGEPGMPQVGSLAGRAGLTGGDVLRHCPAPPTVVDLSRYNFGPHVGQDSPAGLSFLASFLYAGSSCVIASTWQLPEERRLAFLNLLLQQLAASGETASPEDVARGLQAVMQDVAASPSFASVFEWAGFLVYAV